jgi:hypothetical protein
MKTNLFDARPYAAHARPDADARWAKPVFATIADMRYAQELRVRLRQQYLRDAPPASPWAVGVE